MKSMKKTRPADQPYEIWQSPLTGWKWYVLKFYQSYENTLENPYGRVFCDVYGDFHEMGDTYYRDIRDNAVLIATDYPQ
jgi:hypothetical protein